MLCKRINERVCSIEVKLGGLNITKPIQLILLLSIDSNFHTGQILKYIFIG